MRITDGSVNSIRDRNGIGDATAGSQWSKFGCVLWVGGMEYFLCLSPSIGATLASRGSCFHLPQLVVTHFPQLAQPGARNLIQLLNNAK